MCYFLPYLSIVSDPERSECRDRPIPFMILTVTAMSPVLDSSFRPARVYSLQRKRKIELHAPAQHEIFGIFIHKNERIFESGRMCTHIQWAHIMKPGPTDDSCAYVASTAVPHVLVF